MSADARQRLSGSSSPGSWNHTQRGTTGAPDLITKVRNYLTTIVAQLIQFGNIHEIPFRPLPMLSSAPQIHEMGKEDEEISLHPSLYHNTTFEQRVSCFVRLFRPVEADLECYRKPQSL